MSYVGKRERRAVSDEIICSLESLEVLSITSLVITLQCSSVFYRHPHYTSPATSL